ncbi:MAG: hypothetical protein ACREL5_06780 [Gemmatimonadales bacterium]
MTFDSFVVFLNDQPVKVRPGSTLADLLAAAAPDLGVALDDGIAWATDGRGVAVDGATTMVAGAIFRVQRRARSRPADG